MGAVKRLAVAVLLLAACARTTATRDQWLRMSRDEKTLYVRSLIGHEQATAAKGGTPKRFGAPEEYIAKIDAAYARGDKREVDPIFEEVTKCPTCSTK